jgi:hypothetical protein
MSAPQVQRLKYSHEAMIDLILQDPTVTSKELAEIFGYSPGWVSRILAADSFQARMAERKAALVDPIISRTLNERLRAVAYRSVEVIQEKLDKEESATFALDALQFSSAALQLGGKYNTAGGKA